MAIPLHLEAGLSIDITGLGLNALARPAIFKGSKGVLMHSGLPSWAKLVVVAVYLSIIAAGFVFIALVGPLAGEAGGAAMSFLTTKFGPAVAIGCLVSLIIAGYILAFALQRRDDRREYQRTGTITIEKSKPASSGVKVFLWIQAALLAFAFYAIAAGGFQ